MILEYPLFAEIGKSTAGPDGTFNSSFASGRFSSNTEGSSHWVILPSFPETPPSDPLRVESFEVQRSEVGISYRSQEPSVLGSIQEMTDKSRPRGELCEIMGGCFEFLLRDSPQNTESQRMVARAAANTSVVHTTLSACTEGHSPKDYRAYLSTCRYTGW